MKGDSLILNRHGSERLQHYKFDLLIFGVSKEGLAILIYPMKTSGKVPRRVAELMRKFHEHGGLVGCAKGMHDAWDIVSNSPDYKRFPRTYHFLQVLKWREKQPREISDESE